ncbi:hypothetical protein M2140_000378 [Clostridiales Family XIII bacterium PM5-7]
MAERNLSYDQFMDLTKEERLERVYELSEKDLFKLRITTESYDGPYVPCNDCVHDHCDGTCTAYPKGTPKEAIRNVMEDINCICKGPFKFVHK